MRGVTAPELARASLPARAGAASHCAARLHAPAAAAPARARAPARLSLRRAPAPSRALDESAVQQSLTDDAQPLGGSRLASRESDGNGAAASAGEAQAHEVPSRDDDVLIQLVNVHKSFGDRRILAGVDLVVRRGEAVGIIGPSGTGKSTILRIMAGLIQPDEGTVYIRGKPRVGLVGDEVEERLRVGMVFQSGAMFDSLTVGENVGFTLYEHSDLPEETIRQLVATSLEKVGLSGVEDRYPSMLSGGMKKRVALARAIISDPTTLSGVEEVVMYDEPTAGLDPIASTVVEDLMRSLHNPDAKREGGGIASYIVVTHQHSTIRRATDRLVFLHEGKAVWQGSAAEFDTSDEPIVRQFARGELNGPIVYN